LADRLEEKAEAQDRGGVTFTAQSLGSLLTQHRSELGKLYALEIDESKNPNRYRFNLGDDTTATGLDSY